MSLPYQRLPAGRQEIHFGVVRVGPQLKPIPVQKGEVRARLRLREASVPAPAFVEASYDAPDGCSTCQKNFVVALDIPTTATFAEVELSEQGKTRVILVPVAVDRWWAPGGHE